MYMRAVYALHEGVLVALGLTKGLYKNDYTQVQIPQLKFILIVIECDIQVFENVSH